VPRAYEPLNPALNAGAPHLIGCPRQLIPYIHIPKVLSYFCFLSLLLCLTVFYLFVSIFANRNLDTAAAINIFEDGFTKETVPPFCFLFDWFEFPHVYFAFTTTHFEGPWSGMRRRRQLYWELVGMNLRRALLIVKSWRGMRFCNWK
jgi:hypothetical protein